MVPVLLVGGWSGRGVQILLREAEADHGAHPTAGCSSLQHLLTLVSDVARGVEARNRRRAGCVCLHEVSDPARVRRRSEAKRQERFVSPEDWEKIRDSYKPGDTFRVTCTHDAGLRKLLPQLRTVAPRYVVWGDGTSDEMCLGLVIWAPTA